jgi:hypothetical protein
LGFDGSERGSSLRGASGQVETAMNNNRRRVRS